MTNDITDTPEDCETLDVLVALERVNAAIVGAASSNDMLAAVLEEMLDIFDCDRAWLLYPCSLEADYFQVPMERTRPAYPGAGASMEKVPMDDTIQSVYKLALGTDRPFAFDGKSHEWPDQDTLPTRFQIKSQLVMAIHPKGDTPWMLGIHHCRQPVIYAGAADLFKVIGRRIADGLTTMIATEKLRQSEQQFRTLVEHAPEAIVILDFDSFCFVDANRNAEKLFQFTREEILKMSPVSLSPELQPGGSPSIEGAMPPLEAALAGEFPLMEWEHQNASGQPIPCEIRLARLPHPTKRLIRGSITDISGRKKAAEERKDLQARLAHSQKMEAIGNLTGGIAHDFNNLLTIVLGNLDLLSHPTADAEFVKKRLANIRMAAERASSLTHRLLAFARRQPLRPTPVDTGKMLERMLDMLRLTLGEAVEVQLVVADNLWECLVDEAQLENAILNLAINARDAMPEGGRLRIVASNVLLDHEFVSRDPDLKVGAYVLLSVSDTGIGMSSELLSEIFAPFFTTKEVGKGTGLGLSMVYGFVRQSGGYIEVASEPGRGSTMQLYLPRVESDAKVRQVMAEDTDKIVVQGNGEKVLVVEDNEGVRQLTCMLLGELGYETCEASTAAEALALIQEVPSIALLLTDIVLASGPDGAELARLAKELRTELPVLFMSGYSKNAIASDGMLPPEVRLLAKPFTKGRLAQQVREVLKG